MLVAQDLKLDVAWPREVLLDVHITVAEGRERLGPGELEGAAKIIGVFGDAHSLPAPAGGGLDDHRKADTTRVGEGFVDIIYGPRRPRYNRDADRAHRLARLGLVAHHANLVRDEARDVEVRFARRRRADAHVVVRKAHVE